MAEERLLKHKGKDIYYMNFSQLTEIQDIKGLVNESVAYIRTKPRGSVLTLTDIKGMHFSAEIREIFTDFIKNNKPYVKAGAVIGMNGLQMIVYNGIMKLTGRDIKSFATMNEAKDWLADQG